MSQPKDSDKSRENYSSYIALVMASLLVFFVVIIFIDRKTDFATIERTSYGYYLVQENTIGWASIVVLVILIFYRFGIALYQKLKPNSAEVKKIDFVWYNGALLGLALSLLDFQRSEFQANRLMYKSAIISSHSTLRDYCWESDLKIDFCDRIDPILSLEVHEVLEIIDTGTLSQKSNYSVVGNLNELKEVSDSAYVVGPSIGYLLIE